MKRYLITLISALAFTCGAFAMDYETAREQAYYLTDKMAYELNLNEQQYNDAYEINLDYLLSLNDESDIETYWEYRNADLRYILYDWQWRAFMAADYFYRPVWWFHGGWYFPIFRHYTHGYYFYHRPHIFWDYRGAHGRAHFMHGSFYSNRRPEWRGGLRGQGEHMVGHPNGTRGGRYGTPGGGYNDRMGNSRTRGGSFNDRTGNTRTRGGSFNDRTGNSRTPDAGHNDRMDNTRTRGTGTMQGGSRENGRGAGTYSRGGDNNMRSSSRTTVGGSNRSSMGSSRSSMGSSRSSMGSSRSSVGSSSSRGSMGGGSRSGGGFSGGSRSGGGFSGGGRSGGGRR